MGAELAARAQVEFLAQIGRLVQDETELPTDVADPPLSIQVAMEAREMRAMAEEARDAAPPEGAEGDATLDKDFESNAFDDDDDTGTQERPQQQPGGQPWDMDS